VREPDRALSQDVRAWLLDPLEGYAQAIDPPREEGLRSAHRALLEESDVEGARAAAAELLEVDPNLAPAHVLAAQADFVDGRSREIVSRLVPIGDRMPGYVASQLLLGRAAETGGDIPLAYAAYRAVATRSPLALQRLSGLHPRAVEILSNRLREGLRTSNPEEAQKNLALLQSWAPSEVVTLEGAWAVAQARGDQAAELAAVQALAGRRPDDRNLLERRIELELAVGDPSTGLQIAQDLVAQHPGDTEAARLLEAARYRWRLSMLPQAVQEVAAKPDLDKADLAVLLYWLVPNVRYARPSAGRIATDVLDHPHQEEIVRVVNLGLMDVDPTLHRFAPSAPLRRGAALRVLVRTLSSFGQGLTCLDEKPGGAQSAVCAAAAACGLLLEGEECLPGEPLPGTEAVELIRRTLKLLGAS
jgi:tetratricopeptide (TPR) repeat protein